MPRPITWCNTPGASNLASLGGSTCSILINAPGEAATVALVLRLLDFPMAPLLLGFILGGLMEDNLRRSLMVYDGSFSFLWERSITLSLLATPVLQWFLARRGNPKVA